jgi:eukaryotic-like serine/threonine-protein kinase
MSLTRQRRDPILGQELLGRYQVVGRVGGGGVSDVYLARQSNVGNRNVAVKVLKRVLCTSDSAEAAVHRTRFHKEGKLLTVLRSASFVRVFDLGVLSDEGVQRPFMVMEYLSGVALSEQLKAGQPLGVELALRHWLALAEGIAELHRIGVLYRDLSPGNVIIEEAGSNGLMPVLFDFSHVTLPGERSSGGGSETNGLLAGTPVYAAPEMAMVEGDVRGDIFSLCAVLYVMLAGRAPLTLKGATWEDYVEAVSKGRKMPERSLRSLEIQVPRSLDKLLVRGMARNPDDRPGSIVELVEAVCQSVLRSPEMFGVNGATNGLLSKIVGWLLNR